MLKGWPPACKRDHDYREERRLAQSADFARDPDVLLLFFSSRIHPKYQTE
jgi:hypothetical protein